MKNNLLIQTLEKFDKKELNRLTIYLQSNFFNSAEVLFKTFSYIKDKLIKGITDKFIQTQKVVDTKFVKRT